MVLSLVIFVVHVATVSVERLLSGFVGSTGSWAYSDTLIDLLQSCSRFANLSAMSWLERYSTVHVLRDDVGVVISIFHKLSRPIVYNRYFAGVGSYLVYNRNQKTMNIQNNVVLISVRTDISITEN